MTALVLSSLAFFAIHLVPATALRGQLVRAIGEGPYLGLFSLASLVAIAAMAWAYGEAAPAEGLWIPDTTLRLLITIAMLVAFVLAVAGVAGRNPAAVGGGAVLAESAAPAGIFTVTRHPLMVAFALWAGLHLLANPDVPSLVLFGTLAATALFGIRLQDRRKETEIGEDWRRYLETTSAVPFRAVLEGRTRLDLAGIGWWRLAIAVALWAAVLHFHQSVFGMPALVF